MTCSFPAQAFLQIEKLERKNKWEGYNILSRRGWECALFR